MGVNTALVAELRKKTGAGVADCKEALEASNCDLEQATVYLRKKGLSDIKERSHKAASEGTVGYYIHTGGKLGVMVEVNCETDFVAKSADFQTFARDLAMHVAASNPRWVSSEEVPQEVVQSERDIALTNVDRSKPPQVLEKIAQGRLSKFFKETCLLEQPFVKDQNLTIQDLLGALGSKVGEKVVIKRFVRFAVG